MTFPIPDHAPAPLGPGARLLIDSDAVRKADADRLRARTALQLARLTRFLMWMDKADIAREQLSVEWFEAVAPMLPQCQIVPNTERKSNQETDWGRLLADELYLKRYHGLKSTELFNHLRAVHPFSLRWGRWGTPDTVKSRLSEARNKSAIGKLLKFAATISPEAVTAIEDIWIAAESAATLQSAVTGPL